MSKGYYRIPLRDKPWPTGHSEVSECPICGKWWKPWASSYLPCHAYCLFTDEGRKLIRQDPRTETSIARDLKVTVSIIRSVRRSR